MRCEEAQTSLAEQLGRPLTAEASQQLEAHLAECAECRTSAAEVRGVWNKLAALPVPEPGAAVSARFYAALDVYQAGAHSQKSSFLTRWWPHRPIWQVAVCAACLAIGFFARPLAPVSGTPGREAAGEIAELRKEMAGMRQLVTLSLLQQQSAAERLRGVTWSYRAEPNDMEVLSALLQTVNQDGNVDVRLSAVDALRNFGNSPIAQRGIAQALGKQNSPLVQIALIDLLTDLGIRSARPQLEKLVADDSLDANVRKRAEKALSAL